MLCKPVLCPALWHQCEIKYYTTHPVCYFALRGNTQWLYPLCPLATRRKTQPSHTKTREVNGVHRPWILRIRLENRSQTGWPLQPSEQDVLSSSVSVEVFRRTQPQRSIDVSTVLKPGDFTFYPSCCCSLVHDDMIGHLSIMPAVYCTKCWELPCRRPWLAAPETLPLWLKFRLGFPKLGDILCMCFGRGMLETLSKESVPYQIYLCSQQIVLSTHCMPGTV